MVFPFEGGNLLEDSASDGDRGGERAFLVDVSSFNSFTGGLESCTLKMMI
jgi:hypothetical protein